MSNSKASKKKTTKKAKAKDVMDLNKLQTFTVKLNSSKEQAQFVKDIIASRGAEALNLPAIPVSAIQDFIDGKRPNLWEITINGNVCVTVDSNKDAAEALVTLITAAGQTEFGLEPLPLINLSDYLLDKRDNVGQFEMVHNPEAEPKEELPGHLD